MKGPGETAYGGAEGERSSSQAKGSDLDETPQSAETRTPKGQLERGISQAIKRWRGVSVYPAPPFFYSNKISSCFHFIKEVSYERTQTDPVA